MKKLYLEFIRGAAAIIVLAYHFLELHTLRSHSNHFYFGNWGTDAVIIFFILSGVVINISQSNNAKSKKEFLTNRFYRIYPLMATGLLLGILVLFLTHTSIPTAGVLAGNFLMLSAIKHYMINIVPCLESNSPIWSLSYEMVFYLLFAFSIGRHQKKMMAWWFVISIAIMPLYYLQAGNDVIRHFIAVMAFSSIWLTGYYIYEYRNLFYADKYTALFSAGVLPLISRMHMSALYYDPAKYLLFALFAVPFFRYCLQEKQSGYRIKWYYIVLPFIPVVYLVFNQPYLTFSSFMAYATLPVILMGICLLIVKLKVIKGIKNFISVSGKTLGRYSYPVYVVHYPVLFFCAAFINNLPVKLLISMLCVGVLAYTLETYLQPRAVNFLKAANSFFSYRKIAIYVLRRKIFEKRVTLLKKALIPLATTISSLFLFPFNHH